MPKFLIVEKKGEIRAALMMKGIRYPAGSKLGAIITCLDGGFPAMFCIDTVPGIEAIPDKLREITYDMVLWDTDHSKNDNDPGLRRAPGEQLKHFEPFRADQKQGGCSYCLRDV